MSIIMFMLLIVCLALALLGAAGYLIYRLVTREKPPKDFTGVNTPPSFKDVDENLSLPISAKPREGEKSGETR
jgi:hypothetical protein